MTKRGLLIATAYALLLVALVCPTYGWEIALGHGQGFQLGAGDSLTEDIYVPMVIYPQEVGVFEMEYMQHGADFQGDTGFYTAAYTPPIPPGGSRTWSDMYLWAQNYTLGTPYRIRILVGAPEVFARPVGYTGHLVLDYVPTECAWSSPMDFWLDLGVMNTLTMPVITTSDPLQGTRFHLTVYAPVPEPSSILALGFALTGMGAMLRRRR
jgi:hypothetical protein